MTAAVATAAMVNAGFAKTKDLIGETKPSNAVPKPPVVIAASFSAADIVAAFTAASSSAPDSSFAVKRAVACSFVKVT